MMTIYMYWPQVVWAVLVLLGLGGELARHGQVERVSTVSGGGSLVQ